MSERINSRKCVQCALCVCILYKRVPTALFGTEHTQTHLAYTNLAHEKQNAREPMLTFISFIMIAKMEIATQIIMWFVRNTTTIWINAIKIAFEIRLRWMRKKQKKNQLKLYYMYKYINRNHMNGQMLNNSIIITCHFYIKWNKIFNTKSIYILY